MKKMAIMMDGGFIKYAIRGFTRSPLSIQELVRLKDALCSKFSDHELFRVYYYDAPPFSGKVKNPISGKDKNLSETDPALHGKSLIDSIGKMDQFAVRRGECKHSKNWKLKKYFFNKKPESDGSFKITEMDIVPTINQKGVDMRIGLDMAWMSMKKIVDTIVVVSNDSDFIPAMKFARREGVLVGLWPLNQRTPPALVEHTDFYFKPDAIDIKQILTNN